jgi:hypothetical protein
MLNHLRAVLVMTVLGPVGPGCQGIAPPDEDGSDVDWELRAVGVALETADPEVTAPTGDEGAEEAAELPAPDSAAGALPEPWMSHCLTEAPEFAGEAPDYGDIQAPDDHARYNRSLSRAFGRQLTDADLAQLAPGQRGAYAARWVRGGMPDGVLPGQQVHVWADSAERWDASRTSEERARDEARWSTRRDAYLVDAHARVRPYPDAHLREGDR